MDPTASVAFDDAVEHLVRDVLRRRAPPHPYRCAPPLAALHLDLRDSFRRPGLPARGALVLPMDRLAWAVFPDGPRRHTLHEACRGETDRLIARANTFGTRLVRVRRPGGVPFEIELDVDLSALAKGLPAWRASIRLMRAYLQALHVPTVQPHAPGPHGLGLTVRAHRWTPAAGTARAERPANRFDADEAFRLIVRGTHQDRRGPQKVLAFLTEGNVGWALRMLDVLLRQPTAFVDVTDVAPEHRLATATAMCETVAEEVEWTVRGGPWRDQLASDLSPPWTPPGPELSSDGADLPPSQESRDLPHVVIGDPGAWVQLRRNPAATVPPPPRGVGDEPRISTLAAIPTLGSWMDSLARAIRSPWSVRDLGYTSVPATVGDSVLLYASASAALVRGRVRPPLRPWYLGTIEDAFHLAHLGFVNVSAPEGTILAGLWLGVTRALLALELWNSDRNTAIAWLEGAEDRLVTTVELLRQRGLDGEAAAVEEGWEVFRSLLDSQADDHREFAARALWRLAHRHEPHPHRGYVHREPLGVGATEDPDLPLATGCFRVDEKDEEKDEPDLKRKPLLLLLGEPLLPSDAWEDAGWDVAEPVIGDKVAGEGRFRQPPPNRHPGTGAAETRWPQAVAVGPEARRHHRLAFRHAELPRLDARTVVRPEEALPRPSPRSDKPGRRVPSALLSWRPPGGARKPATEPIILYANIPGDRPYNPYRTRLTEIVGLVVRGGKRDPSFARVEYDDAPHHGHDDRIERIQAALTGSTHSLHDLCRHSGSGALSLARLNMPLELGIHLGLPAAAPDRILVLVDAGTPVEAYVSDLSASDRFLLRPYRGRTRFSLAVLHALWWWGYDVDRAAFEALTGVSIEGVDP